MVGMGRCFYVQLHMLLILGRHLTTSLHLLSDTVRTKGYPQEEKP